MYVPWSLVLLLGYTTNVAQGYSSGAPVARCDNMIPAHRRQGTVVLSQQLPSPYSFQLQKYTYSEGEQIRMRLVAPQNAYFRGLLVKVVTQLGEAVGTVVPPRGYKAITCGRNGNEALTHTEKSNKPEVIFIWTAPSTAYGPLTIRTTIVYNYDTFWVNEIQATINPDASTLPQVSTTVRPPVIPLVPELTTTTPTTDKSPVLTTQSEAPPLPSTTTTTTQSTTRSTQPHVRITPPKEEGSIQYDPDCGFSKGCFVDCDSDGCKFMVTWQDVGEAVSFELYGKPKYTDSWIAVGFSKDSRMTDDSVTECVHNGGFIQAYNSYNPSYHNDRLENSQVGLTGVSGSYYNGVFSCRFTRAKRVDSEPHIFDLEKDWNIMFAHGKAVPGFRISVHSETPATSAAHVDFQKFIIVGRAARFSLVKAHGCLMILAWVLFTGVGIVLARYYKNVWADKTFLKLKIWFQAHRACMVTALVLDLIAFIIIFVDVKGYSQIPDIPGKTYLRSHPILGIIVTLLCVANPVMALFRPGPGDSKRPIFNWAHWGVGITAYILSALCICFGFQLGKASTPDYAVYIMIGYIIYVVLFDIACEVHDYLTKKEKKGKVESMEMSNHNGTDNGVANGNSTNYSTKEKTKKSDKLKTILLAVHIAFTGAFALVLVLVVALN